MIAGRVDLWRTRAALCAAVVAAQMPVHCRTRPRKATGDLARSSCGIYLIVNYVRLELTCRKWPPPGPSGVVPAATGAGA